MTRKNTTPRFTADEAYQQLRERRHEQAKNYFAMYSSILGGIVKDPALMLVPLDDHMVHRGHAVFDTAILAGGMLYQLDRHLDRLFVSAEMARIAAPFDRDKMRRIILDTAAASGQRDGSVRYWLSAGPGGFGLSPDECIESGFYVMVFKGLSYPERYYREGLNVITSSVPIKPPFFARLKSNNYLPNVLVVMEAREKGADNGVFLDANGMIGESSNMNVAFVTEQGVLRHPPFDAILSGITVQRMLELAQSLVKGKELSDVVLGEIPPEEGRRSAEMLLIGSSIKVAPVVRWDGEPIGNGKPGPVAKRLLELWREDVATASDQLTPVPYDD